MKITFLGHSAFSIETASGHKMLIDPFLTGNPVANLSADQVEADYIFLTHGHDDHVGDTVEIAKRNDAMVVAPFELATWLSWKGVRTHPLATGGGANFDFGRVELTLAHHGSGFIEEEKQQITYLGPAAGLLLQIEGKSLYHAGDTSLFSDMKLINGDLPIDLAMLPIGDNFTMGPDAAQTAAQWVGARAVIPMHYNTFPPIQQDPYDFATKLQAKNIQVYVLEPGSGLSL
ncbi:metal-dependent hydrolase [Risungbinella massiliensis]|uniref:metal-dependent hydrolase n=1 Tax=Risungbinella massiliensis TaxID=1329796 RepID=UPI0005CB9577|nr:metal-dependent hydrolase [Risungbinella massiliensis]